MSVQRIFDLGTRTLAPGASGLFCLVVGQRCELRSISVGPPAVEVVSSSHAAPRRLSDPPVWLAPGEVVEVVLRLPEARDEPAEVRASMTVVFPEDNGASA